MTLYKQLPQYINIYITKYSYRKKNINSKEHLYTHEFILSIHDKANGYDYSNFIFYKETIVIYILRLKPNVNFGPCGKVTKHSKFT